MKNRAFHLYRVSWQSTRHRLRYEFAQEFVVFLCSTIILATFLYVFNDFLNEHVAALSASMRQAFAWPGAIISLTIVASLTHRRWRAAISAEDGLADWAIRQGEEPPVVRQFLRLRLLTIATLYHGAGWYFIHAVLTPIGLTQVLLGEALLMLVQWLIWWRHRSGAPHTLKVAISRGALVSSQSTTRRAALLRWRAMQILRRSRPSQLCLAAAFVLTVAAAYAAANTVPPFSVMLICFLAGSIASWSLALQVAADLDYAWAERCMGVSHAEFVGAYQVLGVIGAAALFLTFWLCLPLISLLLGAESRLPYSPMVLVQCALAATVSPLMMVDLLLQVDGRRPLIQMTLVALLGLFMATAIFAHPLAVALLPLFKYYAAQSQAGRYYRA